MTVLMTIDEAVQRLDPPINRHTLVKLIQSQGVEKRGERQGPSGRMCAAYDSAELDHLHADWHQGRLTARGHRGPMRMHTNDALAMARLHDGSLRVVPERGEVWRANGKRAERMHPHTLYGIVRVSVGQPVRVSAAHRIIWIAAHGPINPNLEINHRNRLRWDNRISNLELVTHSGNIVHGKGLGAYEALVHDDEDHNFDPQWLEAVRQAASTGDMSLIPPHDPKDEQLSYCSTNWIHPSADVPPTRRGANPRL